MDKKTLKKLSNYIKRYQTCIISYCDNKNFVIFRNEKYEKMNLYDWDVNDDGECYIPNIVMIFLECAKRGIDISKVTIKSW